MTKLTERRWEMAGKLLGQGVLSIRELARRLECDAKRVQEDADALIELVRVERAAADIVCPFDRIHDDFELAVTA